MSNKVTQKQRIRLASLKALQYKAYLAVYESVRESGSLGFLDCLKLATTLAQQSYYDAQNTRDAFEIELIHSGKAWRDSLNMLILN